jgi:hypothetical protein
MEEKIETTMTNNTPEGSPNSDFLDYYVERYTNPPFGTEDDAETVSVGIEECLKDSSVFHGVIYNGKGEPAGFLLARNGDPEQMINQFEADYREAWGGNLYGFDSVDVGKKMDNIEDITNILKNSFSKKYGRIGYIMDAGVGGIGEEWIENHSVEELRSLISYFYRENKISVGFWITHKEDYAIHLMKVCGLEIESLGGDDKAEVFVIRV